MYFDPNVLQCVRKPGWMVLPYLDQPSDVIQFFKELFVPRAYESNLFI